MFGRMASFFLYNLLLQFYTRMPVVQLKVAMACGVRLQDCICNRRHDLVPRVRYVAYTHYIRVYSGIGLFRGSGARVE